MLAALIAIPCLILSIVFFFVLPDAVKWLTVVPLAIGIGVFVIRHGINEWWYSKYPPIMSEKEKEILRNYFPYYKHLNEEVKKEFEERVMVFRLQKQFQMRGFDKIPGDVNLLICAIGVQLTMGFPRQKEFYPKLGMIVLFAKTFITPDINEQHHAVEFKREAFDSLYLAVNMVVKGIQESHKYYNIGLYGFIKAFRYEFNISENELPHVDRKVLLVQLHELRLFPIGYIFEYTGLGDFEIFEMCAELFFQYPEQIQVHLPALYTYLVNTFQQDPVNRGNPVIQLV